MSMRERPILFSAESICAILRDAKTQTRRVIKFPRRVLPAEIAASTVAYPDGGGNWVFWGGPDFPGLADFTRNSCPFGDGIPCPYGKPGDRLWVRETYGYEVGRATTVYRADVDAGLFAWKSPIFMPRSLARLFLEVVSVRAEQLHAITEEDARAEGVGSVAEYVLLWNKLNAKRGYSWESNPWIWRVEFRSTTVGRADSIEE